MARQVGSLDQPTGVPPMSSEFSLFLDLTRFVAACLVLLAHSNVRNVIAEPVPFSDHAHTAVIVFFVLSGYVIAFVTDTKERTPRSYWMSRMTRIYSVALPALLLTPILDVMGERLQPAFYAGETTHNYWYIRLASSAVFTNELWFVSIMSFSNVPYWSLCYEVWYYALFGIVVFCRGCTRVWLLLAGCALIGPKILLLVPLWLLGVFLYRYRPLYRVRERFGWLMFGASFTLFAWHQEAGVSNYLSEWLKLQISEHWHYLLVFSKWFLGDYILGVIIAMYFAGFRTIAHRFTPVFARTGKAIRLLASYSFSIYLFHQPLLLFYAALIDGDPEGIAFYLSVLGAVVVTIAALGSLTEHRKEIFRSWLTAAIDGSLRPALKRFRFG